MDYVIVLSVGFVAGVIVGYISRSVIAKDIAAVEAAAARVEAAIKEIKAKV